MPVGKARKRQQAAVAAAAAVPRRHRRLEFVQRRRTEQRTLRPAALLSDQRRAEGSHQLRNIGAYHLAPRHQLEGTQQRVVPEGSALHDDAAAQLRGVLDLQHLIERILNDGIDEPCGDVAHRGPLLLCLAHARIHKYRAARTEIHGRIRLLGGAGELVHLHIKRLRETLEERAAA